MSQVVAGNPDWADVHGLETSPAAHLKEEENQHNQIQNNKEG